MPLRVGRFWLFALAVIATIGAGIYANSLGNSFQFDDIPGIIENPRVHNPLKVVDVFNFWPTRFLNYWSIAWNYLFSGTNVFSYHIMQIVLHILNGFLVFVLIRTLAEVTGWKEDSKALSLLGALLFVVHPIQSQPVNYISQRAVLLLSLFYLLSVVFYLQYRIKGHRRYYVFSFVAMIFTIFSKEPSVALPIMLLMLEILLFKDTKSLRVRLKGLLPFVLPLVVVPALTVLRRTNWGVDFTVQEADAARAGIGVWEYFLTEISVVRTYLRLFVLPVGQSFDWDYPIYKGLNIITVISALLHTVLIAISVYFSRRERIMLFSAGVLWFYIGLLPESSFFPIFDVIFEHRVYLPLVGLSMATASLVFLPKGRLRWVLIGLMCIALVLLSVQTVRRNTVWRAESTLWEDSLQKAPRKERVRHMLGVAYKNEGRFQEAVEQFLAALAIGGRQCVRSKYELSETYFLAGRYEDSVREVSEVLAMLYREVGLPPTGPEIGIGQFKGTVAQEGLIRAFTLWDVHTNLGSALFKTGRVDEAIAEYRRALYLKPNFLSARNQLGLALKEAGRYEEAVNEFEAILKESPDFALAHESLSLIYIENLPNREKARYHVKELLKLIPEHPSAEWFTQKLMEMDTQMPSTNR